jgi:NADH-quinone oxidoreductase subunit L
MMVGLATGGIAIGMFHLITHAFFKALLFLGAGSVIHGNHDEQDIRHMGRLRIDMPLTFVTYLVGMLALSGFPIFFSGFWSKDAIIGAAHNWPVSKGPFVLLLIGALLTAFYMTRQVSYVFFGHWRGKGNAHESPMVMTIPLSLLAIFAIGLGVLGTPLWPWFIAFIESKPLAVDIHGFNEPGLVPLMGFTALLFFLGLGLGWWLYARKPIQRPAQAPGHQHKSEHGDEDRDEWGHDGNEIVDVLESASPRIWNVLAHRLYFDEIYEATVLRWYAWLAWLSDWFDRRVWGGLVTAIAACFKGLGWMNRSTDAQWIDGAFDKGCEELVTSGGVLAWLQMGRTSGYLRSMALGLLILAALALVVGVATGQVRL